MSKTLPIIVAVICGFIGFATMAVLGPSKFDYADDPEERQQQRLDNIAKGFEIGFKATSGGQAVIERIRADAGTDSIAVDIRFIQKEIEFAPPGVVADFRKYVYKHNCVFLDRKSVLDEGVTLKIRTMKPSGALLTNFSINKENCAPYLNSA